jgi:hypothetical protein
LNAVPSSVKRTRHFWRIVSDVRFRIVSFQASFRYPSSDHCHSQIQLRTILFIAIRSWLCDSIAIHNRRGDAGSRSGAGIKPSRYPHRGSNRCHHDERSFHIRYRSLL